MMKLRLILVCFSLVFVVSTGCGVLINPTPEINVKQDTTDIPSEIGEYNFYDILVGNSSHAITFTIENNGKSILKLDNVPNPIVIASGDEADFIIDQKSIQTELSPKETTTFTITFNTTTRGAIPKIPSLRQEIIVNFGYILQIYFDFKFRIGYNQNEYYENILLQSLFNHMHISED